MIQWILVLENMTDRLNESIDLGEAHSELQNMCSCRVKHGKVIKILGLPCEGLNELKPGFRD